MSGYGRRLLRRQYCVRKRLIPGEERRLRQSMSYRYRKENGMVFEC